MPLTIDNSPALVGAPNMALQKSQRVKVVRPFFNRGEVCGVDSIVDLPTPTAFELKHANKVIFVQADTRLKATDTVPEPADGAIRETGKKAASA